ncbi:conserved hypothetical protein [groundwater metagenome]|uniref:DUF86 domain-containing protein n=1 Tax=groundwater metagenome TaxID=717931 RepID=A0A098EE24_9ZZZZ
MYDLEKITIIIADMEKYFEDMEKLGIRKIEDLDDIKNFYSVSMLLFAILNRAIDLGEEIVLSNNSEVPATYKDIFRLLSKNKIIDKYMEKEISNLIFYRNLLAHEYFDIENRDVFDVFERIGIIKNFADRIKSVIKEEIEKEK